MWSPVDEVVAELLLSSRGSRNAPRQETVRAIRQRVVGDHGIVALEYEDEQGHRRFYARGVARHPTGRWAVTGGAGWRFPLPGEHRPGVELGHWSHQGRGHGAAGLVHDDRVRRVRLEDRTGDTMEDVVESGVALLIREEPFNFGRTNVETCDGAGALLDRRLL